MALDVKYVEERSFLVDWKIIFQPSAPCCSATENNSDHRSAEPAGLRFLQITFIGNKKQRNDAGGRPSVFVTSNYFSTAPRFALVTMRA